MRNHLSQLSVSELLALIVIFAFGVAAWTNGKYNGWAYFVFIIHFVPLVWLSLRLKVHLWETFVLMLPICSIILFIVAMLASLRHPPFMVGTDFEWPPFQDVGDRAGHAFVLSLWQVVLAPLAGLAAWLFCSVVGPLYRNRRPA